MKLAHAIRIALLFALGSAASAQNFNIDVCADGGASLPSPAYVGATTTEHPPQSGPWNAVAPGSTVALFTTQGIATEMTLTCAASSTFDVQQGPLTGDDRALMYDGAVLAPGVGYTYTFRGFPPTAHTLYTYAWGPLDVNARTEVTPSSSVDPALVCGGAWNGGSHVALVTYTYHDAHVQGGTFSVTLRGLNGGPGYLAGFQFHSYSPLASFCSGDGAGTDCPCGTFTPPPRGCANSYVSVGAELWALGNASVSADTFRFGGNGFRPATTTLLIQGTSHVLTGAETGAVFGDGLRCVGGTVVRLGSATANTYSYIEWPPFGSPTRVSVLGGVAPGDLRHYQGWYRDADPAFCTSATFNLTNGITILWEP